MLVLSIVLLLVPVTILTDLIYYIIRGRRWSVGVADIFAYLVFPVAFLFFADAGLKNDCCSDSALFSPQHRLTVYLIIAVCIINYFYCFFRERIAPPVLEVVVNSVLIIAIALNVVMIIHLKSDDQFFHLLGNVPVILLSILMLLKNQTLFKEQLQEAETIVPSNRIARWGWKILTASPFVKYPALILLCLPLLVIVMMILLLFGQKPDSLTRAFTDTYKHGLSQLDHECVGVVCEGHYLCTIAARGHKQIVKPVRLGKRGNDIIICNRQLLISNAFEELLQERLPSLHRFIRTQYDRVGDVVQKYYGVFNNKFISDLVYILMKPLEWSFLLVLYCCDRKPENRIAKQYTGHHFKERVFK